MEELLAPAFAAAVGFAFIALMISWVLDSAPRRARRHDATDELTDLFAIDRNEA